MKAPKLLVAEEFLKETQHKVETLIVENSFKELLGRNKLNQALKEIYDDLEKINIVLKKVDLFQIIAEHEKEIKYMEAEIENIKNHINHNNISNKRSC